MMNAETKIINPNFQLDTSSADVRVPSVIIDGLIKLPPEALPPSAENIELPILTIESIDHGQDYRDQLPPEMLSGLPSDCRVVFIRNVEIALPLNGHRLDSLQALLRLFGVKNPEQIGDNGAPNAAVALINHNDDPSLHRFEAVHGRDALDIARRLGKKYPKLLRNTILDLAKTQGVVDETYREGQPFGQEEVGKIILVDRSDDDPVAQRFAEERGWGFPFYGSVDATINYVNAIAEYVKEDPNFWNQTYQGRGGQATIRESYDMACRWLYSHLNSSSGFIEFKNKDPRPTKGIDCQSWRDSDYAYIHKDGTRANVKDGIASFDVQVATYQAMVNIANVTTSIAEKEVLLEKSRKFKKSIIDSFWVTPNDNQDGFFALGLDRDPESKDLRQLEVKTSSMAEGLFLLSKDDPADKQKIEAIVKHLMSDQLLSYAGLRTLANDEKGYALTNYHSGAVWLHDTARVADALDYQGYHHLAMELRGRILRVARETNVYPEFVGGEVEYHKVDGQLKPYILIPHTEAYAYSDQQKSLFLFGQAPQLGQGWVIAAIADIHDKAAEFIASQPLVHGLEAEIYDNLQDRATNL